MNFLKLNAIVLASLGLIVVTGCSNTAQTTDSTTNTEHSPDDGHNHGENSDVKAQAIESGKYNLEFLAVPENEGTHIDLFLKNSETNEPIADAKVTAQVQLPTGEQKTIDMEYYTAGEHYVADLDADAEGEYKVVIQTDVDGEKANGRFSFNR